MPLESCGYSSCVQPLTNGMTNLSTLHQACWLVCPVTGKAWARNLFSDLVFSPDLGPISGRLVCHVLSSIQESSAPYQRYPKIVISNSGLVIFRDVFFENWVIIAQNDFPMLP